MKQMKKMISPNSWVSEKDAPKFLLLGRSGEENLCGSHEIEILQLTIRVVVRLRNSFLAIVVIVLAFAVAEGPEERTGPWI